MQARKNHVRISLGIAAVASITLTAMIAAPAQADVATALQLPAYGDLVIDDDHDQVFVSGGPSSNGVVVTNLRGHVIETIPGQYGATGLALDTANDRLYVANAAGDAISVVDLDTLREVDRITTGARTCPTNLTRTDDVLWFGYGCDGSWNGGIGRVEFPPPSSGPETDPCAPPAGTPTPKPTGSTPPTPPRPKVVLAAQGDVRFQRAPLVTAPDDCEGPLVAGQPQLSLSTVYVYAINAKTNQLTTRTSGTAPGSNLYDIALDRYADTLFTGAGSRNSALAYSTDDLSGRGSYYSGYYPLAVAPSPDGYHLAVGVRATGDDVYVYEIGGVVPERRLNLTGNVLAPRGLRFSPDSETLYAISQPPAGGAPTLHVVHDPT